MFPGAAVTSMPSSFSVLTASSSLSGRRPFTVSAYPRSFPSIRAIAKPIPDEPPVISAARSGIFFLQLLLQDFSGCVARKLVEELDLARHLVAGQVLLHVVLDFVLRQVGAARGDDERLQPLTEVGVLDADDRGVRDLRVLRQQLLDLTRVHVLAARDDHVVLARVDEKTPALVDVAHVTGRHEAFGRGLLRATARVALEYQLRADEDAARLAAWQLVSFLVDDLEDRPLGRLTGRAGCGAKVGGRRDRGPSHLGRPIEVVKVVAERVHPALGEFARQGGAACEDDPQRARVVLRADLLRQIEDPREHDGDDGEDAWLVLIDRGERCFRVEAVLKQDRRAERGGDHVLADAPCMEQGGDDEMLLAHAIWHAPEQAADWVEPLRRRAAGPLWRAGRAGGQDHELRLLGRRDHVVGIRCLDQVLDQLVARDAALFAHPGNEALRAPALRRVADQLRELGVVDRGLRLLALEHLAGLRPGEARVQVERAGADLGAGDRRLDEVAVVAREYRNAVALDDPAVLQGVRERVRTSLDLAKGEVTERIFYRRIVRVARGAGRGRRGWSCAPADQDLDQPGDRVGPLRTHESRARERVERVELRLDLLLERQPHPVGS